MSERALNQRQREFVRLYCAGPDGVRGIAAKAYAVAGYRSRDPEFNGPRLLRRPHVAAAVIAAHEAAAAEAKGTLRCWKELCIAAQARVVAIARGVIPSADDPIGNAGGTRITNRDTAAAAKVILDAALEILDRGYPKKHLVHIEDPERVLAELLGMTPDEMRALEAGRQ